MRTLLCYGLMALTLAIFVAASRADEETCASCERTVEISGRFTHFNVRDDINIQGAPAGGEAAFHHEVWGANFSISAAHLPAGKYTVVIGEAEGYFSNTGQRVFTVTSGDTVLATNFDIVAAAGGADKVCYITGQVDHAEDAVGGPLVV